MDRRRFLGAMGSLAVLPALGLAAPAAAVARVTGCRMDEDAGASRLTLDLSGQVPYRVFTLSSPPRVVLDLDRVAPHLSTDKINLQGSSVASIRSGPHGGGMRVVLDMRENSQPRAIMRAGPRAGQQQLVVHLPRSGGVIEQAVPAVAVASHKLAPRTHRPAVIAIDAGHGGKDPGAVSASDHYEKHIALGVATRLHGLLEKDPAFTPKMSRADDRFVALHERVLLAHQHDADLFVSIHADAAPATSARGASVYVLSEHGATSAMARFMAESENSADRYAPMRSSVLNNPNRQLSEVLMDMSMDATISSSLDLGRMMIDDLAQVTRIHQKQVDQAGFAVLKSPDIPSILVETGFMSNPDDCRRLLTDHHQEELADSLKSGISNYFKAYPLHDMRA